VKSARGRALDVVLLSGGLDSACVLLEVQHAGGRPEALFIHYGQAAASREREASHAVARKTASPWREVAAEAGHALAGEIIGRNAFLIHAAQLTLQPKEPLCLYLGIHAGTGYRDCTPEFVSLMQDSLDFHSDGRVRLVTPFLNWAKGTVFDRARELGVPIELTYSCERGADPCGSCRSCVDREALLASA
jgi:7-cyano-7-deazaguanine synthase